MNFIDNNLSDEIVVKTEGGDFKLLKQGKLVDLSSSKQEALIVPQDDLIKIQGNQDLIQLKVDRKPVANFYFDVDDEYEIRKLSQKGDREKNRLISKFIDKKAEVIIKQSGLSLKACQNRQLKNIIISFLRNVRSVAQTKEALKNLINIDQAREPIDWWDIVIELSQKEKKRIEETIKSGKLPTKILNGQYDNEKYIKQDKDLNRIESGAPSKLSNNSAIKKDDKSLENNNLVMPKASVMGAVDEIRAISLADFRRMSANPDEAVNKILQKINFLEDESIVKKNQGVRAWHEAEPYQLYLKIGKLSMIEKKPVEQIIRELNSAGQKFLTPTEFNAIADLNIKLSY